MEHAGHAEVLHVRPRARYLGGDVDPLDRLPDDRIGRRILERCVLVHLQPKLPIADQLAVQGALGGVGVRPDHPVLHREIADRHAELRRRHLRQGLPRRGRCLADLHTADLDREAAPRRPLIRRERGVALDERDLIKRDLELLGGDLPEGGAEAGPEIHLSGEDRHRPILGDGEERVDLVQRDGLRSGAGRLGERGPRSGECEAHDQRARPLQELPAGRVLSQHVRLPSAWRWPRASPPG